MSVKCSNCGLVGFADNQDCRRCGMPLGVSGPAGWYPEPRNPGSVVDSAPAYGAAPNADPGQQAWNPGGQGWPPPPADYGNAGYGGQGYGAGYNPQAYGGTYGTYSPGYGQQAQYGGYAPSFGYPGFVAAPYELADRGSRLLAAILDTVCLYGPIAAAVTLGIMIGEMAIVFLAIAGVLAMIGVIVAQLVMLAQRGQTIVKRVLGIRIVKMDSGLNGGGVTNIVLRGLVPALLGMVPYIGPFFSIVNVCFIFAADRRCVHDHIAGTVVVRGEP